MCVRVCVCVCVCIHSKQTITTGNSASDKNEIHHIFSLSQPLVFKFPHKTNNKSSQNNISIHATANHIHVSRTFPSYYSFSWPSQSQIPMSQISILFTWVADQQIFFFFLPRSEINNGCFSGLQSAGGGENELLGGIKYQGERLGLIRDFLSEKMFLPVATAGLNSNQWKWKRCPCVATGSNTGDLWVPRVNAMICTCCPLVL